MGEKQTPLIELLENVPRDTVLVVEHDLFNSSFHPVGRLCHEAATELRRLHAEVDALRAEVEQLRSADDEVVFIDGVGASRSSVKSCRDGVQWIRVGDRVYWPLSDADAQRLQSACCGNGHFDGPTTPAVEGANND
jgi:hypothetical protein